MAETSLYSFLIHISFLLFQDLLQLPLPSFPSPYHQLSTSLWAVPQSFCVLLLRREQWFVEKCPLFGYTIRIKLMNGQISLLNKKLSEQPEKKATGVKVYIEDADGNSYSTRIGPEAVTIEDAILQAVRNFNRNIHAELPETPELYELFAAKNGKKDTGLPSFEKSQPVGKVGKERFFLVCLSKDFRLLSNQTLPSVKPRSMEIGSEKEKREESNTEKGGFCFCGGW